MDFTKLLVIGVILIPGQLLAQTMQKPLDLIEWRYSGDSFHCQMETALKFDGQARILVRSGQSPVFTLETFQRPVAVESAWLSINKQVWRIEKSVDRWLDGDVTGDYGLSFYDETAIKSLLNQMEQGAWVQVSARDEHTGNAVHWDIPAVNFTAGLQDMKRCMAELLPMDFAGAQDNQFHFATNQVELAEQDIQTLKDLATYINYDSSLSHILIDGHTDNEGHSLSNLDLSRQRAVQVRNQLINHGVDGNKIQLRAHGQRYPMVPNINESNRKKNRRVQVRLVQGGNS